MVVAVAPLVQDTDNRQIHLSSDGLHIDLHLTLTLGITAQQAKRKLSRFLMDEVSLFLGPEAPLLVLSDTSSAFWRFPIEFSMARRGRIGQVGMIDVNAQTGELQLSDEQLTEIKLNARLLARGTALSTDA